VVRGLRRDVLGRRIGDLAEGELRLAGRVGWGERRLSAGDHGGVVGAGCGGRRGGLRRLGRVSCGRAGVAGLVLGLAD
jgi:hypothetical protein